VSGGVRQHTGTLKAGCRWGERCLRVGEPEGPDTNLCPERNVTTGGVRNFPVGVDVGLSVKEPTHGQGSRGVRGRMGAGERREKSYGGMGAELLEP